MNIQLNLHEYQKKDIYSFIYIAYIYESTTYIYTAHTVYTVYVFVCYLCVHTVFMHIYIVIYIYIYSQFSEEPSS